MQNPGVSRPRHRIDLTKAPLNKTFRLLASLKVAIPLLVVLVVVTIVGSLFPTPDFFATRWYLALRRRSRDVDAARKEKPRRANRA